MANLLIKWVLLLLVVALPLPTGAIFIKLVLLGLIQYKLSGQSFEFMGEGGHDNEK